MSLTTSIATGTLLGGLLATGVYLATAPGDEVRATAPVAPSLAPVPTPTVTRLADCTAPAELEHGACVTHVPGPRITVAPTSRPAPTTAGRTAPAPAAAPVPAAGPVTGEDEDDDHGDEREDEDHDEDHGDDGGDDD